MKRFAVRVEYPGSPSWWFPSATRNEATATANKLFDLCLDLFPDVPVFCFVIEV